uniref:Uncharacterized protein n=1 Tax=Odontella aurita TaxID=265563 RepID=A0A7S4HJR3_9STRA|mmetsp:Transcript_10949/g.32408  ORF Transcript_10949/g.32408 Transcript_10949/m.32408 type:complete len:216 (+) Transcript_10949:1107-1754(+)
MATLASLQHGKAEAPIKCIFTTLQDMQAQTRTAFGESTSKHRGNLWAVLLRPPLQGLGQGNGAGPQLWAVMSIPILEALRECGFGAKFHLAATNTEFHLVGFAFVDDTNQIKVTASNGITIADVRERAQAGLYGFVGSICARGRDMQPGKMGCYLLDFRWMGKTWEYVAKDEYSLAPLHVKDPIGQKVTLTRQTPLMPFRSWEHGSTTTRPWLNN